MCTVSTGHFKAIQEPLDTKYVQSRNLPLAPSLVSPHLSFQLPCFHFPIHSRTLKKENRTRVNVIVIDIGGQLRLIPIRHTRTPDRIQIVDIQIRRCSGVVHKDGSLALGIGGLGRTA